MPEVKKTPTAQIVFLVVVVLGFMSATLAGLFVYVLPKFLISKYLLKNKEAKSNILRDTIIAGLVLGVISLIGQNAVNQNKPVSTKEPTELRTTKNDTDEELIDTLYRNTKYGFRIKFPEGWDIKKGDGIHVVQKAVLRNSTISVMVQQFDLNSGEKITSIKDTGTAKEYIDNVIEGAKLKTSDVEVIDYGETKIDNEPAYWVEYSGTYQALDKKVNMTNIIYFIAKGNTAYSISAGTATNEYQEVKPTFTRTVSTFVLEKYE